MSEIDVAVVGAGISGLATAHWLTRQGRSVQVFEADDGVGGRMRSHRRNGYLLDTGAETLAAHGYPSTWRLLRELGVAPGDVLPVRSAVGLWRDGRVHPWVGHPLGGITGAGLSPGGRLHMMRMTGRLLRGARRFDVRRPEDTPLGTMTVAEFARSYPPELHDYLLQPAVGTAFGWRPEHACMGPFVSSMLSTRGIWKWRTYRDGMDFPARTIAERVPVRTTRPVAEVVPAGTGVRVTFRDGDTLTARQVVLAVPAPVAAELYPAMPEEERAYVRSCHYAPMARVSCLLDRPLEPPRGRAQPHVYALLVPGAVDDVLSGLTIEHNKAADRAPRGRGLVTLLPAADVTADLLSTSDGAVIATLLERAERYLPGVKEACLDAVLHRFPHGSIEARPETLGARPAFVRRAPRAVEYAGDWLFLRASSEGAVDSAGLAAARVMERHRAGRTPGSAHRRPSTQAP
ncbi:NAD(P)/FAD-dependent oxidoreductase [Streptomyces sp. Go-475]|uniref:protoporphyrinogen/coproporphyrinogen oxidase n=1 Tax=Streptomyces sp. Go-475 TaxID=2072505 RepID=UPI000DEF0BF9|nr:NAD(P)/FAD-dependent oxidoreductase [Streptomyces sp. Go-475]AXE88778.1 Dehydrosqualene desaturase [Streptomyces sp. Go-475]